jgi:hypothetical protein
MTPRVMALLLGALSVACGSVRLDEDGGASGRRDGPARADREGGDGPADGSPDGSQPDVPPPRPDVSSDEVPPPVPDAAPAAEDAPVEGGAAADLAPDAPEPPPSAEVVAFACPPDDALVACYSFDDPGNRLMDGSRHGNHGMINSARVTPGVRGSALSFVAGNEFAIVPASPSLRVEGTGFTFEAWIRPTMSPIDNRVDFIAARWNAANVGFLFGTYAEELAINSSGGTGHRSEGKLPLGRWSHVAVVVGAANVILYIQGSAEAPQTALTFIANDEPLTIGNRNPAQSPDVSALTAFRGDIDVLRIYARAKRPAEICADANRTWNGTDCVNGLFAPRASPQQ